jgi:hypothetical protein
LELPHEERKKWCEEISRIHKETDKEKKDSISLGDL